MAKNKEKDREKGEKDLIAPSEPTRAGDVIRILPEILNALRTGKPVVALESAVFAQGLPIPANREAAWRMLNAVRARGVIPAITGVVRGKASVGLEDDELDWFLGREGVLKLSARDLALAVVKGADGATTVAATLMLAHHVGIEVFATGGIGGVHREPLYDESADLVELSRTPMIVVCAGAKSILNLTATMERLETLGVPVVGFRTSQLPGFLTVETGIPLPGRVENVEEIVQLYLMHRRLSGQGALVVMQPPPREVALPRAQVESAVEEAVAKAEREGVRGGAMTPFLLAELEQSTRGLSLGANLALLEHNAALAADIANALSRGR
ncbi:MAG: pseudouridine-5'-phosphate glycosidase [Gemmatimonadota bacterium]|nr:pseudouridine-5'-phosphate glycosidase [Gemmatimonadota bacterium]